MNSLLEYMKKSGDLDQEEMPKAHENPPIWG
jgi:hypothetical protein